LLLLLLHDMVLDLLLLLLMMLLELKQHLLGRTHARRNSSG
jgi:hypothetical protein